MPGRRRGQTLTLSLPTGVTTPGTGIAPNLDAPGGVQDLDGSGAWPVSTNLEQAERRDLKRRLGLGGISDQQLLCPTCGGAAHGLHPNVLRALGLEVRQCPPVPVDEDAPNPNPRTTSFARNTTGPVTPWQPTSTVSVGPAPKSTPLIKRVITETTLPVVEAVQEERVSEPVLVSIPVLGSIPEQEVPTSSGVVRIDLRSASTLELRCALQRLGRELEGRLRRAEDLHVASSEVFSRAESDALARFGCGFEGMRGRPECEGWMRTRLVQMRHALSPWTPPPPPSVPGEARLGPLAQILLAKPHLVP